MRRKREVTFYFIFQPATTVCQHLIMIISTQQGTFVYSDTNSAADLSLVEYT